IQGVNILKNEFTRLLTLSEKAIGFISDYKTTKKESTEVKNLISNLDNIDGQIMKSDSSQISSFLLQPIINEISKKEKAKTFDEGIDNSEELYLKIKDSADFHESIVVAYLKNNQNLNQ
ncbi:MAG: hypothetical protein PF693_07970, partial [Spirochaetia bacterium]|nr:hypothetical protein [Spirochaetia bacterium]